MGRVLDVDRQVANLALVGNPNAGKSSIFNRLTGLRQHVGNFPGVTVDKKTGRFRLHAHAEARLTDLPGTYSLYPTSRDEHIVLNVLTDPNNPDFPDAVVYVADVNSLERHLLLLTQVLDLGLPTVLALNMIDLATKQGFEIDAAGLSESLGGLPVVLVNGRTGEGMGKVKQAVMQVLQQERLPAPFYDVLPLAPEVIEDSQQLLADENPYRSLLLAHHHHDLPHLGSKHREQLAEICHQYAFSSIRAQVNETMGRYDRIVPLAKKALVQKKEAALTADISDKIDRVLTHPIAGGLIFMALLFFIFQAIFALASYPMEWIDQGVGGLSASLKEHLPESALTNLLTEGIIAGIGGIVVFVPQIAILFFLITLLEESGYMARAVFLSDSVMRRFGLNGRSIVSLISGVACAIPAIMATRTITDWKERLITIFVTPLMSCSARIPVFTVLVALAIPQEYFWGVINLQGLVIMGLYLLGTASALLSAWVLKQFVGVKETGYFIIEMPSYRMPQWKNVAMTVYEKVKTFVVEAGKVIFVISIILWFMASYGPGGQMEAAEEQVRSAYEGELPDDELAQLIASRQIEVSYAGHLGRFIEPAIAPLGFDWKIGIALITSFAAREVFVGTMATIYSVGDADQEETIIARLREWKNPETGEQVFNMATSLSLLIYYVFAMQCMSTLAIVKRETKTWRWPMLQLLYMSALAYLASLLTYQLLA